MTTFSIGIIGAGNIATAILNGLLESNTSCSNIIISAPSQGTRERIHNRFKVTVTPDNTLPAKASTVLLCVKPRILPKVLNEIASTLTKNKPLLVSVAAGVTTQQIHKWIHDDQKSLSIIRAMPNTPSLIKKGAIGLFACNSVPAHDKGSAEQLFRSMGVTQWVAEEKLMDVIIAVSGSAPAYYFLIMKAVRDIGIKMGLSPEASETLTLSTALGAATMANMSNDSLSELIKKVCSPNGTTEKAIEALNSGDLYGLLEKAMQAAVTRSQEITEELDKKSTTD